MWPEGFVGTAFPRRPSEVPQEPSAKVAEAVPPKLYGGTERIVAYRSDALVGMGHDVTQFASGNSEMCAEPMASRAWTTLPGCYPQCSFDLRH